MGQPGLQNEQALKTNTRGALKTCFISTLQREGKEKVNIAKIFTGGTEKAAGVFSKFHEIRSCL